MKPKSWKTAVYRIQVEYNRRFAEDDLPGNYYRPVVEDGINGPRTTFARAVLNDAAMRVRRREW